ncbi:receptor-like protein EIX2 isoform X2 [Malus sylvestris]|uniref:receptor-like protein EIX2 isoform X2 n=1 Tax=Malus sylvestris TaxID=3752 RepID=UPI0021AD3BFE|nr:receptor-like protein EIX2 isoform X2 [Malus sylvestris]
MENDGIRCLKKLFHTSIVVLLFLQCFNPSLSSGFYNVSFGFGAIGHRVVTRCIESEGEALLSFKQGLIDDYNLLSSWGREEHKQDCCKWLGIHCSNRTNHVTQLDLGWNHMNEVYSLQQKGQQEYPEYYFQGKMMSPKLIELQHLKYLDLSSVNFTGTQLPDFIGSLSNLRHLGLWDASFGGRIPTQIGNLTHLQYLDLTSNHFANLENLNSWLPRLSSLTYLDLSFNNLSNVPDWMEAVNKLPKLTNLSLSYCSLPSPLIHSSTLFNINSSKSLAHVDLSDNQLTSSSIFLWLSKYNASLGHLDLRYNNFANVENLNSWLPHLSALTYLDLSYNNLSNVPDWMEAVNKLPKLTNLSLYSCSLPSPLIHSSTLFNINSSKSLAHVDLSDNQLTSSSIFLWLSKYNASLGHLDLRYNNFANVENLNSWLPHLSALTYLDLSENNLSNVHDWMEAVNKLPKLTNLSLSYCSLPSPLTHSSTLFNINSSRSLAHVVLNSNQLTSSSIFVWLSNFSTSLVQLGLSHNNFTGSLPDVIGNMSSLASLDLSFNQFEGVISESHFSGLSRLRFFSLSSTSLTLNFHSKWVPPFQLDYIILGSCKMGPYFPNWLQTQKSYRRLDISNAGISDILPSWFWERLSHAGEIDQVDLSNNQIRGTIPNSQINLVCFYRKLNLSWNQLEGQVPPFLLKASSSLFLSHNKFSGLFSFLLPVNASHLRLLDLSSNHLHGELPDCWTHFKNLLILDLSDNLFSGRIPATMGFLSSIQTLNLNTNGLVGELPSSLKNCTSLIVFDVGENKLSGLIPEWLGVGLPNLTILILRSNHFYGSIPSQLCNMGSIQIMDFSMNNISGGIPKCLNNLTNLALRGSSSLTITHLFKATSTDIAISILDYEDEASLIWNGIMSKYKSTLGLVKSIHLSSNRLTGEIPSEVTDLVGLVSLNLSRNNLTGQITPKIGKLQSLDLLDLSNNQIHGTIPTSLFGISGLGKLDLSNNHLSGKIPMGSQLQTYEPSVFAGNPLLCGIPLQTCFPEETTPAEQPVVKNQDEDNDRFITTGFYVSLGLGFVVGFWGVCGSLIFDRSWRYTYFKLLNGLNDWLYVKVALLKQRRMLDE